MDINKISTKELEKELARRQKELTFKFKGEPLKGNYDDFKALFEELSKTFGDPMNEIWKHLKERKKEITPDPYPNWPNYPEYPKHLWYKPYEVTWQKTHTTDRTSDESNIPPNLIPEHIYSAISSE